MRDAGTFSQIAVDLESKLNAVSRDPIAGVNFLKDILYRSSITLEEMAKMAALPAVDTFALLPSNEAKAQNVKAHSPGEVSLPLYVKPGEKYQIEKLTESSYFTIINLRSQETKELSEDTFLQDFVPTLPEKLQLNYTSGQPYPEKLIMDENTTRVALIETSIPVVPGAEFEIFRNEEAVDADTLEKKLEVVVKDTVNSKSYILTEAQYEEFRALIG